MGMTIFQLGNESLYSAVLEKAAELVGGRVHRLAALDAAPVTDSAGDEVLALCDPDEATAVAARAVLDSGGLPRWAVVIFHSAAARPRTIGEPEQALHREEWLPPIVARVLTGAIATHRARREAAQFRGDLATFGHRVAHDLRTPLGGVLTTTEMLREILAEDAPADVPLTQPILDSTDGLVRLIDRTSFFAKIASSNEPPMRWNMGTLFWNAFQRLEAEILKSGATITQPSEWPMIDARGAWIEAVWVNLISNALQHAGAGVRMESGWAGIEGGYRFWLWDSGAIAPERRATLFFPFNRLHETGAPRGFGLSIARRIVEREGGRCGFEAPESGGSRLYFTLPAPPLLA